MSKRILISGGIAFAVLIAFGMVIGAVVVLRTKAQKSENKEQSLVVEYLKKNANDPSSVEIVEWGEPSVDDLYGKHRVKLAVKVRAKNRVGALEVRTRSFEVIDGRLSRTVQDILADD